MQEFLSKKKDDTAEGLITFLKGLVSRELSRFKGGAEFGEFVSGMMTGFGGAIDSKGNAEFESARIRSALWVVKARVIDPFGHAGFDPSGKTRLTP